MRRGLGVKIHQERSLKIVLSRRALISAYDDSQLQALEQLSFIHLFIVSVSQSNLLSMCVRDNYLRNELNNLYFPLEWLLQTFSVAKQVEKGTWRGIGYTACGMLWKIHINTWYKSKSIEPAEQFIFLYLYTLFYSS